jgi:hypothetical protein
MGRPKQAIMNFVARTCGEDGSTAVPPEERVAVFDNDGTLWCEKPMRAALHPSTPRGDDGDGARAH